MGAAPWLRILHKASGWPGEWQTGASGVGYWYSSPLTSSAQRNSLRLEGLPQERREKQGLEPIEAFILSQDKRGHCF